MIFTPNIPLALEDKGEGDFSRFLKKARQKLFNKTAIDSPMAVLYFLKSIAKA